MANFTTQDFGGQSPYRPMEPVVDKSSSAIIDALGKAVDMGSKYAEGKRKQVASGVIDRFTEEQVRLADAVDQGAMTVSAARTQARANYLRYASDNPGMSEELLDRNSKILNQAGLGKVITTGSDQAQTDAKILATSQQEGWPTPESYLANKMAMKRLEDNQKKLNYKDSMSQYEQDQQAIEARSAMVSLAQTSAPKLNVELEKIVSQKRDGLITEEQAIMGIKGLELNNIRKGSQTGAYAGSQFVLDITQPMQNMLDIAMDVVKGTTTLEVAKKKNDLNLTLGQSYFLNDPVTARIVGGSQLLQNSPLLSLIKDTNSNIINKFDRIGDVGDNSVNFNNPADAKDTGVTLQIIKGGMKEFLDSTESNPVRDEQLVNAANNILNSVDIYDKTASNATAYNNLLDYWSSDTYGSFAEKSTGLNREGAAKALHIVTNAYERDVVPLIRKEYEAISFKGGRKERGTNAGIKQSADAVSVIKPEFSGAGLVFRVDPNLGKESRAEFQRRADKLNKELTPLINRLIRTNAHLQGGKKYRESYDVLYERIFGVVQDSGVVNE